MSVENEHFVAEGLSIVEDAQEQGLKLRILGSLAYRIHCPANLQLFEAMERALTDIDFSADRRQSREIKKFLVQRGYEEDQRMTASTEGMRYYFEDPNNGLGVDVFYNELFFCHKIPLRDRLDLDSPTITTCDLLLEKMQIVELNLKDVKDTLVLMLEHPVVEKPTSPEEIDGGYIADLLSGDWGFYYTVNMNLDRVERFIPDFDVLSAEQGDLILSRINDLRKLIEDAPKSRKWKLRAKVGTKKQWYQDVAPKGSAF